MNLLLLVVLGRTHLLLHNLEDIDAGVALDRGGAELALSRGSHGTREGGLSSSRKEGQVSQLFEAGKENDHLIIAAFLSRITSRLRISFTWASSQGR